MPRPYHSEVIPGPIEEVWKIVTDFGNLAGWHPAVRDSVLARGCSGQEVSAQRTFTVIESGAHVREEIVALDNRFHTLVFTIVEGPYPIRNSFATIRLTPLGASGQTFGEWWVEFDADLDTGEQLAEWTRQRFFVAGLDALAKRFS